MITKRILTMKSKVGRGKYPNEEIGRLIDCECANWVRWVYYHYEDIDFIPEVKKAAGIVEEIPKPGVDNEAFLRNERGVYAKMKEELGELAYMVKVQRLKKTKRIADGCSRGIRLRDGFSKGRMARVNQGHGYIKGD